ncbi:tyrosine recombinase [uncultured Mobiluncus sp.]|uniref:tyrosine recombinase n=1 Tax=uncultured Mobiluncus sp. TaxID=293425 RepID=UPI00280422DE|nr:tyrosine recombinase [uncultured Mobiluncus sp.]
MGSRPAPDFVCPERLDPQPYLDYLAVERGASPHTVAAYTRDLRRYVTFLVNNGVKSLDEVTLPILEAFVRALEAGFGDYAAVAPSSARRAIASVRSWHRYAYETGAARSNPTKGIAPAKVSAHLPTVLTVEEVQALLEAASAPGDDNALRDRALLEFLYATGARISEAVNLAVDDIDLDEEIPLVRLFGKGRKERLSMLGHLAKDALEAYLVRVRPGLAEKGRSQGRVFLNTLGRPLSRQSAWAIIQAAAQRAQITVPVGPHTLRHCFATHLLQGGADVRAVQELLGHASVTTTQIYTKVSNDMLREVYASAHPRARWHREASEPSR